MKVLLVKDKFVDSALTVGKEYHVIGIKRVSNLHKIRDDVGSELVIRVGKYCHHIGCDGWGIVQ